MEKGKFIVDMLKREVVPAIGCTEPVAVALACAKAKELLNHDNIKKIEVFLSPNVYKNGLSVGIPNTNEVGLHIAAALGTIAGKSEKELKVLENIDKSDVKLAKSLIEYNKLSIKIKDTDKKIYIEAIITSDKGISKAIIEDRHNEFTYLEKNNNVLLNIDNKIQSSNNESKDYLITLSINEIIKEIEKIPFEDISFLLEGLEMNEVIAKRGLIKNTGMGVGFGILQNIKKGILSDDFMNYAMMLTAAASDARMSGVPLPVMSSSGSGNNGLTAILPLVAYKEKFETTEEEMARALAIAHTINSYIKHHIGRLSVLCGCGVAAGTGVGVAIAWLMGANGRQIDGVVKNMIANTSGMICDGAKEGCALKLSTSVSAAIQSALLAINDNIVPSKNGIVATSAEETIRNLGELSVKGMGISDRVILDMMKRMEDNSVLRTEHILA